MKNLYKFRQIMAEKGKEMTPVEAAKNYKSTQEVRRIAEQISQLDLWVIEEFIEDEEDRKAVELFYDARGSL